ncbi:MAG: hypothetical protein QXW41_07365 [Fervidicoccaceae archaeon]
MSKVKVKEADRLWAEPVIVSVYLHGGGDIYAVYRFYTEGSILIQCYETEQELGEDVFSIDSIEEVVSIVKEVVEREKEKADFIEIEANSRIYDSLKKELEEN